MNRRFLTKTFLILLFTCFFYLIFVFKSFSGLTGGAINVSLISPSDNSFVNTKSINFTFNVSWNESIVIANCTLYGNFTGVWASNQTNHTEIVQGENGINITLEDGSYEWNVYCFNETEVYDFAENNFTLTVDTESPNYSLNSTDSTLAGTAVSHNLYWQDNIGLSYAIFSFDNCTGSFQNISEISLSGTSAWSNFTVIINDTIGCTIKWKVYANDTSGNWNESETFSYTTTNALPTLSYLWTFPVSNTTYEPRKSYVFNVTACDLNGASDLVSITFEWNDQTNYTYPDVTNVTHNSTCLNFSITLNDLPAGNHNYKWYVNDSQNEWAFLSDSYTITRAVSNASLILEPESPVIYENRTVAKCTETNPEADGKLWRNGTDVTSENNTEIILPVGTWEYVCNVSETQNYTSASDSKVYTVEKKNARIQVYPLTQNLTYPASVLQYCTDESSLLDCNIYRNDSLISNYTEVTLAAGVYVYKANITDTMNYTNYEVTQILTINKGILVGTISAPAVTYPTPLFVNSTESNIGDSDVVYNIYCNDVFVASAIGSAPSSSIPLGIGSYVCKLNTSAGPFANWTANATIAIVETVVNAPSPPPSAGPGIPLTTTVSTTPGKAVIFIPLIAAMSKANVSIQKTEGIDFTQIVISVKNKVVSVQINITKLDAKPEETPALVNVYRYIRVDKKNIEDENVSEVKIVFKVEKSWVATNNINPDTIALYRYTTKWEKLNTVKMGADSEYLYYEATSPGLSYFAIAGEKSIQVCPFECCIGEPEYYDKPCPSGYKCENHSCVAIITPCIEDWICTEWSECIGGKQTRICKDRNECGTTKNKPEEERSCEVEKPTFAFWLGIVLVIILIVIISKYVAKKIKPTERPKVEKKPRKPRRQKK
jgi:PGF-pre-PGF domain-containing protein